MARRSVLFTPGDRPEMVRKAPETGADVLAFDLEDGVAPERKDDARKTVRETLADRSFDPDAEVWVRVNPADRGGADDLAALFGSDDGARSGGDRSDGGVGRSDGDGDRSDGVDDRPNEADDRPDAVVLPKVESAGDVSDLASRLGAYESPRPIVALIETARGVLAADEIAAVAATDALVFGAEDLAATLGATRTPEGTEVLYARERVVLAAAAHGCDAIDTLVTDFEDDGRLREDAAFARQLGYDGKLAIHPAQVEPINGAFTPDRDEIEWAQAVLAASEAADATDRGVFKVDGEMIDAPLIARAERIVARARAAGAID